MKNSVCVSECGDTLRFHTQTQTQTGLPGWEEKNLMRETQKKASLK
jgi:hypothetical protein